MCAILEYLISFVYLSSLGVTSALYAVSTAIPILIHFHANARRVTASLYNSAATVEDTWLHTLISYLLMLPLIVIMVCIILN